LTYVKILPLYIPPSSLGRNNGKSVTHKKLNLFSSLNCTPKFGNKNEVVNTVKPVYKGHSMEPENVPFMSSCPLYTG
jgi:hypothetical protein